MAESLDILLSHCYREANKCVDALASMSCKQDVFLVNFYHPPDAISLLLLADVQCSSFGL